MFYGPSFFDRFRNKNTWQEIRRPKSELVICINQITLSLYHTVHTLNSYSSNKEKEEMTRRNPLNQLKLAPAIADKLNTENHSFSSFFFFNFFIYRHRKDHSFPMWSAPNIDSNSITSYSYSSSYPILEYSSPSLPPAPFFLKFRL